MSNVLNPDQSNGTQPAVSGHNRNLLTSLAAQAETSQQAEEATEPEEER